MEIRRLKNKILRRLLPGEEWPLRKYKNGHFIFIHINKTGGTSISEAVGLIQSRHLTAKEVIEIVGVEAWQKAYKFTIVRNPWDKVVSHYKYRVKTNQTAMRDKPIAFDDWVKCTYGKEKDPFYYDKPLMFQPQSYWLKDHEEQINFNRIGRFEQLETDYELIRKDLLLNYPLPHLNATTKVDFRSFYNNKTTEIVANWFAADIIHFDYSFE